MLSHVCDFSALAKKANPDTEVTHGMSHRQTLLMKQLEPELEAVMKYYQCCPRACAKNAAIS